MKPGTSVTIDILDQRGKSTKHLATISAKVVRSEGEKVLVEFKNGIVKRVDSKFIREDSK